MDSTSLTGWPIFQVSWALAHPTITSGAGILGSQERSPVYAWATWNFTHTPGSPVGAAEAMPSIRADDAHEVGEFAPRRDPPSLDDNQTERPRVPVRRGANAGERRDVADR